MAEKEKLKIGVYWAASCGGCDVAITHLNEMILDLVEAADIVFWPCAMDFKYDDVRAMPDGHMDVCLFNGAVRNSDHEEIARLLRQKTKAMVAFGACACFGGIPGLSNESTAGEAFDRAYLGDISTANPERTLPLVETEVPEGQLVLPRTWDTVQTLGQTIDVEYLLPGCPPTVNIVEAAVKAILSGELPPPGSTIAGDKALCEECPREKRNEMRVTEIREPWEAEIDPELCLLEQGIICMGPATVSGCGAQCTKVNMPCRGCFGPPRGVRDQGAAMLSALASVLQPPEGKSITELIDRVRDPLGTFYRFSLADSTLRRSRPSREVSPR